MTPEEIRRRLLDAIAGPESGGRYDVRYGGRKGPQTFTDFSQHPGIFERRPDGRVSSAAGRYQFVKTTWDKLGGGPFTPENQDARAIQLAEQDFKRRTGQDLMPYLQKNGFDNTVISALKPTWEGFKDNPQVARAAWNGQGNLQNRMATGGATPASAPVTAAATPKANWNEPEGVPVMQTAAAVKPPVTPPNGGPFFGEPEGVPVAQPQPDIVAGLLGGLTSEKGMGLLNSGVSAMQKQAQAQDQAHNNDIKALYTNAITHGAQIAEQAKKRRPFQGWDSAGLLG